VLKQRFDWRLWVVAACLPLTLGACETLGLTGHVLTDGGGKTWYRGNTHTHTLWSDGDAAPEVAVAWYKDQGYDFLCLSDHNILSDGSVEKWKAIDPDKHLTPERFEKLKTQFGADWPVVRTNKNVNEMRLKTLPELRAHFEEPGRFILIQAEEITGGNPDVHVNGLNIREVIKPSKSTSATEAIEHAFTQVDEQGQRYGIPTLPHLNHPNFAGAVTAEELAPVRGERFFEVYNGHPGVRNWGRDSEHKQSTDKMWDICLALRLQQDPTQILYGMATDDTHRYFEQRVGMSNAGRGWLMVLASDLETDSIMHAMKRGDFYATLGVTLRKVAVNAVSYSVEIDAEPGVTYTTQFIGTPREFDARSEPPRDDKGTVVRGTRIYSDDVGRVFAETTANPAVYRFTGDELYVRAKIISSKAQHNPFAEGDVETAWTQPALP
jgi:hypothetical protein